MYATIISDWNRADKQFTFTIPANTTAAVMLPAGKTGSIGGGTHVCVVNDEFDSASSRTAKRLVP